MLEQYLVSMLFVVVLKFRNFSWDTQFSHLLSLRGALLKLISYSEGHKCNECEDFVLCSSCFSEHGHPHLMTFKRFSREDAPITSQPEGSKEPPPYVEPAGCHDLKAVLGNWSFIIAPGFHPIYNLYLNANVIFVKHFTLAFLPEI